jgi:hypothetical protein
MVLDLACVEQRRTLKTCRTGDKNACGSYRQISNGFHLKCRRKPTDKGSTHSDSLYNITLKIWASAALSLSAIVIKHDNDSLKWITWNMFSVPMLWSFMSWQHTVLYVSATDNHCLVFMSCRQRTSHYIDTTICSYVFVCSTSEKEQTQHKVNVYILLSGGTVVSVHTTYSEIIFPALLPLNIYEYVSCGSGHKKQLPHRHINPFQSNFSANRILPSSYLFWAVKRLVDYL